MKPILEILLVFMLLALGTGCQAPLFKNDDKQPNEKPAVWDSLNFESERPLLNLYASPYEIMAISENQFFRFDANQKLLEQRPLSLASGHLGVPVLSDNTFVRLTSEAGANDFVEFRLTRNPMQMIRLSVDSLKAPNDAYLEVDFLARRLGAFSNDGTLFLLPAKAFPAKRYVLLLFEIRHNVAHDAFESVELIHRIQLEGLDTDFANLVNIRFLQGNFYISSQEGAWRLTPDGELRSLFPQWMMDFFEWKDDLYVSGINTFDLHKSKDNGLTWDRLNQNTILQFVETPGDSLFNQNILGQAWTLPNSAWANSRQIKWPASIDAGNPVAFYGLAFLNGQFYFSIDRKVFFTDILETK